MNTPVETPPARPVARTTWWRRSIPVGLIAIAVVLVSVVAWMPARVASIPAAEVPPVNVVVQRVEALPELADTFDLTGVVEPERVVKVAAEVAGRIERLGQRPREIAWRGATIPNGTTIREGEPVSVGDPLVYLNKDLLQARYDRAAAQFDYDEREYRRLLDLFERGSTPRTELDDARTRRDVSKAVLDEVTRELERCTINAPVSGILDRLPMEVGEYASPGDPVAEIVDIDTVKVIMELPEREVPHLKVGDRADIVRLGSELPPLTGTLSYIAAVASEGTRTTRGEVRVDNHDHRLHTGQIVRARLTRRVLSGVILIPLASVIPLEEGKVVYVVKEDRAERREVDLGLIKGREVQVLRGLEVGDRLIVEGHRYVGPGQAVNVVEER